MSGAEVDVDRCNPGLHTPASWPTPLARVALTLGDIVFGEEQLRLRHGLELEIVAAWILEEARPLLAWHALEA